MPLLLSGLLIDQVPAARIPKHRELRSLSGTSLPPHLPIIPPSNEAVSMGLGVHIIRII